MAKIWDKFFNRVIEGELQLGEQDKGLIPSNQSTVTIIANALTNLNGRVLSSYEATGSTVTIEEVTYDIITITYGGETVTKEQAENYMEYMTGSRFLPVYNYEKPQNALFIMANGTVWKPQFDSTNGLILYKMPTTLGGRTTLYQHIISIYNSTLAEDQEFAVISSVPTAITSVDDFWDLMSSAISIKIAGGYSVLYGEDEVLGIYQSSSGGFTEIAYADVQGINSDTVDLL